MKSIYKPFPAAEVEQKRILSVLEAGYQTTFNPERARQLFRRASGLLVLENRFGDMSAVGVLGDSNDRGDTRIMMACGLRSAESRASGAFIELLTRCKEGELANWISVGIDHKKVQYLCVDAGMQPLDDESRVYSLIQPLHHPDEPLIDRGDGDAIVVRGVRNPSGAGQYIFS